MRPADRTLVRAAARLSARALGAVLYLSPWHRPRYLARALGMPPEGTLERCFRSFLLDWFVYRDLLRYRNALMAGPPGDAWAEAYHRAIDEPCDMVLGRRLDLIQDVVMRVGAHTVLEVGCSGGRTMRWLADRLPASIRLIGTDLNPRAIALAHAYFADVRRIRVVVDDALTGTAIEKLRPGVVYTSGAATYFTEAELEQFIQRVGLAGAQALIFGEPIRTSGFTYGRDTRSTPRGGMAMNHAYGHKLAAAGAIVQETWSQSAPGMIDVRAAGYFIGETTASR